MLGLPAIETGLPLIDSALFGDLGSLLQLPGLVLPQIPSLPLFGDLGNFAGNLGIVLLQVQGERIDPLEGTETFEGTISHGGLTRHYVGVRPVNAPAGAPVLLLLHAHGLKPARMANLTRASRLAAQYGAWVYLPEANGNSWHDDPAGISLASGTDDVGFLDALVRREVAAHGLDAKRVYAAGYSNGGFMAERLVCERPALFAGLAMVASTLRSSVAARCTSSERMPMLMFNGTNDPVVNYNGVPTLSSARATAEFWSIRNGCSAGYEDSNLPNIAPNDGTTVSLRRYRSCVDSEVRLYTINGGGHTWPGTTYAGYTIALGSTTFDIDATLALWQVLIPFSKP